MCLSKLDRSQQLHLMQLLCEMLQRALIYIRQKSKLLVLLPFVPTLVLIARVKVQARRSEHHIAERKDVIQRKCHGSPAECTSSKEHPA
jgi:hypothetical protein